MRSGEAFAAHSVVMAGLDPAIHALTSKQRKTWITGSSPVMTVEDVTRGEGVSTKGGFSLSRKGLTEGLRSKLERRSSLAALPLY